MIEIDLDLVKRIALFTVAVTVAFWMAFRHTHDLDDVENRGMYRMALGLLLARGMLFTFESFGWLARVE